MSERYTLIRYFIRQNRREVIRTEVRAEQALCHLRNRNSKSSTVTDTGLKVLTSKNGPWRDFCVKDDPNGKK